MKDEQKSAGAGDALPTIIRGLKPEELFARGMKTVKMSTGAAGWRPPSIEEMGALFPGYEVLALLGQAGVAAIYKARQTALDRFVAIKLLSLDAARDRQFEGRFKREAQTLAGLNHPNLVSLYNFGQTTAGHLYMVLEYVEGASLHDLVQHRSLTPARVVRIIGQVCEGLAAAHRAGFVHRDLRPANILVDVNGIAKVADFGLSRSIRQDAGSALTLQGVAVGTLDYMATEQRRGLAVDHRADIYTLGVVLYESLTGKVPRAAGMKPASELAHLPPQIDGVIARAMHDDPAQRYQSAGEFKLALEAAPLHAAAVTKPAPAPATPPPSKRRNPAPWIAAGAAALILAVLGYVLSRPAKSVRPVAPRTVPTPSPVAVATRPPATPAAIAKTAPAPQPAATPAPPAQPLAFGGSRYQLIRSQVSWMQAKTEAEFKGGHLATITTAEEAAWVREIFGPELPRKWARIWIGAYQTDRDDTWHWVTDEEFKFADWARGQPDAARGNSTPPFVASLSKSNDAPGSDGLDDSAANGGSGVVGYLIEWDEPKPVAMATPAPVAMATPTPAPAAMATPAPVVDEAAPRLAALQAQYDAAYARDIATTFDTARDTLRTNYQAAIDREIARASQAGRLAEAVALREERVRASLGKGLDSDAIALPAVLQPLRAGYRTSLAKIETERAAKLAPIRQSFLRTLDAEQSAFVRAQKPAAALAVKQRRDALAAEWAAESQPVAAVAIETRPMSAPAPDTASWRSTALLALRFRGRLEISTDGRRQMIHLEAELPSKRFDVVRIELIDAERNAKMTDADLAPLAHCKEIQDFKIERAPITAQGLEALHGLPELRTLRIYNCPQVTDAALPIVASLRSLTHFEFTNAAIGREALKPLTRLSKLRRLNLSGRNISAASLAALATVPIEELTLGDLSDLAQLDLSGFRQLRNLGITGVRDAKARVLDSVTKLRGLETLRLGNAGLTDDDFAKLASLGSLRALDTDNGVIRGAGLAALRSCRSLDRLRLANCGLTDAALETIGRDLSGLRVLSITGANQIQGAAFRALMKCRKLVEVSVSEGVGDDATAAELAQHSGLEILNFNNCPQLSDSGLQSLTRAKSIKRISLNRCTKLTEAGIAAFRKARPEVNVQRQAEPEA